jgi:hypothetical protein
VIPSNHGLASATTLSEHSIEHFFSEPSPLPIPSMKARKKNKRAIKSKRHGNPEHHAIIYSTSHATPPPLLPQNQYYPHWLLPTSSTITGAPVAFRFIHLQHQQAEHANDQ